MLPQSVFIHNQSQSARLTIVPEETLCHHEKMLIENMGSIVKKTEALLEDLDNDCNETIEFEFFGLQIYVDVATRGWSYRNIELLAVDVLDSRCNTLSTATNQLFNSLLDVMQKINSRMEKLHTERK